MIIVDTNQLRQNESLDTPTLGLLQAIAHATGHELALPAIVIEEFLANFEHRVESSGEQVRKRLKELRSLVPNWKGDVNPPDAHEAMVEHGTKLRSIFTTLPLKEEHARIALRREAWRHRPASVDWDKPGGARDAAIWLTVLDSCTVPDRTVFFVSGDADFGRDTLHKELLEEATKLAAELVYCPDVPTLLGRFGEACDSPISDDDLADAPAIVEVVQESLSGPDLFYEIALSIPNYARRGGWLQSGLVDLHLDHAKGRSLIASGRRRG